MTSLIRKQRGFTIVELLIVIVVIGILAALVITTFAGIQSKGRDSERQTDIKAIHGQLEVFFATYNGYPSAGNINDGAFRNIGMKGFDAGALQDPRWASGTVGCTTANTIATTVSANCYSYTNTAPASCGGAVSGTTIIAAAAGYCTQYLLTATLENAVNGTTAYTKSNLN